MLLKQAVSVDNREGTHRRLTVLLSEANFARAGLNFYSDITHQYVAMRAFSIVPHISI